MPYYQRSWSQVLRDDGQHRDYGGGEPKHVNHKPLRTIPLMESVQLMSEEGASAEQALTKQSFEPKVITMDELAVCNTIKELSKQANECVHRKCCDSIESSNFSKYVIQRDRAIFRGMHSQMCLSSGGPEQTRTSAIVCRIFKPSCLIDSQHDIYLKILRHLGTKNAFVVGTFDMFADQNGSIYLFMEYADTGNAMDYVKANKTVSEDVMRRWARNIYRAMDFLGGMAIAHRDIYPKHVLLHARADQVIEAKLGGFRDAIVYWDPVSNDTIDQPCKPISQATAFQAPEMFSSVDVQEYYNPVDADIWSFGCSMYFLVAGVYPFKVTNPELELVIRHSIAALSVSNEAKCWLWALMHTNAAERFDFDEIAQDEWFISE